MSKRALHVAAYDIGEAKRLRLALRVLKGYATGGQKSVFECFLSEEERRSLVREMIPLIEDEDRFLLLRLDPRSEVLTYGIAVAPSDPEYFYVG
jgi:CRISPR-associated protein Cas2